MLHDPPCPVLADLLNRRRSELLEAWAQAVARDPRQLSQLLDQILSCLLAAPLCVRRAEQIGADLAHLCAGNPHVLGRTPALLRQELANGRPEAVIPVFRPRLMACISALGTGFAPQVRDALIGEYTHIHQSLITDQQCTTVIAREQVEQLWTLVAALPVALVRLDATGVITLAQGRDLLRLCLTPDRLVGQSIFTIAQSAPDLIEIVEAALAGEAVSAVVTIRDRLFAARYHPLRTSTGGLTGTLGIGLDITPQNNRETVVWTASALADLQTRLERLVTEESTIDPAHITRLTEARLALEQIIPTLPLLPGAPRVSPPPDLPLPLVALTRADREVLTLLMQGQTNARMAATLGIGRKAVEQRLTRLFRRLGVATRSEAVTVARRIGFDPPADQTARP